jgi:hypothetical protein
LRYGLSVGETSRGTLGPGKFLQEANGVVELLRRQWDRGLSASAPRGAKIKYETMHGHESTESTVRFIRPSFLDGLEGVGRYVRHQWRWEEIATPERGRDDACLSIMAPSSGHVVQGPTLYEFVAN